MQKKCAFFWILYSQKFLKASFDAKSIRKDLFTCYSKRAFQFICIWSSWANLIYLRWQIKLLVPADCVLVHPLNIFLQFANRVAGLSRWYYSRICFAVMIFANDNITALDKWLWSLVHGFTADDRFEPRASSRPGQVRNHCFLILSSFSLPIMSLEVAAILRVFALL